MTAKFNNGSAKSVLLFLSSQSITLFGSTLSQMAIVWYATLYTSSGFYVAAFSLCTYLPQFLLSFPGGALADLCSRKALIICSDLSIAASTLVMLLLLPHISGKPLLFGLLLLSLVRSFGAGIQTPAVSAVIPTLAPKERLMTINGLSATMQSAVQFAAPAAAGLILTAGDLRLSLLADILTAVLGTAILVRLPIPRPRRREKAPLFGTIKKGLRYAASTGPIARILLVYSLFVISCVPGGFLSGLFVSREFEHGYSALAAAELAGFGGMTLGGLLMSLWGGCRKKERTLLLGLSLFGLMECFMGMSRHFLPYLALMFLYGTGLTMVQTSVTTILQEQSKPSMEGRVLGLMSSLYSGLMPLAMALFGPLADRVSLRLLMTASGILLLLAASFLVLAMKLHPEIDHIPQ